MRFLRKEPNPSGAYPPIQETSMTVLPHGCAAINDVCDTSIFYEYNGFVTLNLDETETVVMSFTPNITAWEEWKASLPEPEPEPPPQPDEMTLLKAQTTALSERQDFLEDCVAEMAMEIYG